jgi:hypothetical protein
MWRELLAVLYYTQFVRLNNIIVVIQGTNRVFNCHSIIDPRVHEYQ